ncbi:MAG: hypothetical protein Q9195_001670 [Heterodermia aff. obscurata]
MECVKRNIGHLCTKDERQPRAKKAKTDHNGNNQNQANASQSKRTDAEQAIRLLEHFVGETSRPDACPSGVLEPISSSVAPDYPNGYWVTTNNPSRYSEKIAVLRGIVDALPELDMIRHLYEVFVTRCQGPLGNIVHKQHFLDEAEVLCGCLSLASPESRVMELSSKFSLDVLACHLLAVRAPIDPCPITERPRAEFTRLSYTVHALELAILARESIDLRGPLHQIHKQEESNDGTKIREYLNKKYESFVTGLPSYFRLGSTAGLTATTGPMAAIPVHRWMLHQQLWSLFLKIHRDSLSSQDGRTSCQLLAQNIINNQAQIQARCAVCSSLSTNKTQLFSAATVLLIDLLFSSQYTETDRSSAQLNRLMIRDRIQDAIALLQTQGDTEVERAPSPQGPGSERVTSSTPLSVTVLETLLTLEEQESGKAEAISGEKSTANDPGEQAPKSGNSLGTSLKTKIVNILEALQANAKGAAVAIEPPDVDSFSALDTPGPCSTTTGEGQDLDVLPILYDDPNYNFWEFLNLSPPPQSPAKTDV